LDQQQGSVVEFMQRVEFGDSVAEQTLWCEFYDKLMRYVENRIYRRGVPVGLLDVEAVTVSVLESVFKCAKQGRLQNVQDWSELSRLLLAMTNRKFVDHWRRATAQRVFPGTPPVELPLEGIEIPESELPTCSVIFEEQLSRLMEILPDELHRQIAVLKLAEYTLVEISQRVNRAVPTVNRKWRHIRRIWADELER
jgi:DNA-directed RNA polymerase specialized sigma24 family protein